MRIWLKFDFREWDIVGSLVCKWIPSEFMEDGLILGNDQGLLLDDRLHLLLLVDGLELSFNLLNFFNFLDLGQLFHRLQHSHVAHVCLHHVLRIVHSHRHLDLVFVLIVSKSSSRSSSSSRFLLFLQCFLLSEFPCALFLLVPVEHFVPPSNGLLIDQNALLEKHDQGVDHEHEQDQANIVPTHREFLLRAQHVVVREQVADFKLHQEQDFIHNFNVVELGVLEGAVVHHVRNPPDREVQLDGKLHNGQSLDHCDAEHDEKSAEEEEGVVEARTQGAWSERRVDFSPPPAGHLILKFVIFENENNFHEHHERAHNHEECENICQNSRLEGRKVIKAHLNQHKNVSDHS